MRSVLLDLQFATQKQNQTHRHDPNKLGEPHDYTTLHLVNLERAIPFHSQPNLTLPCTYRTCIRHRVVQSHNAATVTTRTKTKRQRRSVDIYDDDDDDDGDTITIFLRGLLGNIPAIAT